HDMDQDMTLLSKDLVALENLNKALHLAHAYIERARPEFEKRFGKSEVAWNNNNFGTQLFNVNRLPAWVRKPISGDPHSEILYSVNLDGSISIQIYFDNAFNEADAYLEALNDANKAIENEKFTVEKTEGETGSVAYKNMSLGQILNDEQGAQKVHEWFVAAFKDIQQLIEHTQKVIPWKEEVKPPQSNPS
ncbi:MAG: hypothetical protein AAFQ92_24355, partial [Bacteroidota bacterium]